MKGAAKCDKHCELQNSVNQQVLERILRFRDIPESMPASVSTSYHASGAFPTPVGSSRLRVFVRPGAPRSLRRIQCIEELLGEQPSEHLVCFSVVSRFELLLLLFESLTLLPRHEVRSANPLNLSI